MPSNYETLRDYADAKTHFLDQRKEAGFDSGTEEQFFEWLHAEYVPSKPKPLTIPQRRAVDIAHAIFTCAISNQETDTFSSNGVRALPCWRNYCETQWLDPDRASTISSALNLLANAGLVRKIGATKNRVYKFEQVADDEAYRILANTVRGIVEDSAASA